MFRDKWSHDPKCMSDLNPHLDLSQDFQLLALLWSLIYMDHLAIYL